MSDPKPVIAVRADLRAVHHFVSIRAAARAGFRRWGIHDVVVGRDRAHRGHFFVFARPEDYRRTS